MKKRTNKDSPEVHRSQQLIKCHNYTKIPPTLQSVRHDVTTHLLPHQMR